MKVNASSEKIQANNVLISVIIVNFNGRAFLYKCLQSLLRNVSCKHEIIVVDNNSDDGSREYITDSWPGVKLLSSPDNLGFARGNNYGAASARGKYLLLLNNDTEMLEPLQPLIDYLELHPDTAVAGGRLRNTDGSVQASVGYDHTPCRLVFSWALPRTCTWFSQWQLHERRPEFYLHDHHDVDWVSGAYLCIRRQTWQDLRGFDSDIFMYAEDVDICRRVRLQGRKVAYVAAGDTCHFEGGGQKGMSGHALLATVDSYQLLLAKRYGGLICAVTCFALSVVFLVRALLYLLSAATGSKAVMRAKSRFYWQAAMRLWRGRASKATVNPDGEGLL